MLHWLLHCTLDLLKERSSASRPHLSYPCKQAIWRILRYPETCLCDWTCGRTGLWENVSGNTRLASRWAGQYEPFLFRNFWTELACCAAKTPRVPGIRYIGSLAILQGWSYLGTAVHVFLRKTLYGQRIGPPAVINAWAAGLNNIWVCLKIGDIPKWQP